MDNEEEKMPFILPPQHMEYMSLSARRATFKTWPKNLNTLIKELVEAGFFYSDIGDRVFCFYCGGGLNNWSPLQNPWREHAAAYPNCFHVKNAIENSDKN